MHGLKREWNVAFRMIVLAGVVLLLILSLVVVSVLTVRLMAVIG